MIDPFIWNAVPFGDRNAFLDFEGQHQLWSQAVADHLNVAGTPFQSLVLWNLMTPDGRQAHQQWHINANHAVGILGPGDLVSYDLRNKDEFASWVFLHAQESARLRVAAGVS